MKLKTTLQVLLLALSLAQFGCKQEPISEELTTVSETVEETNFLLEEGAVFGIHFNKPKEDASLAASRNFLRYTYFPNIKDFVPGSKNFYLRPDRGPRLGNEVTIWIFQDKPTRNKYFPEKDFPTKEFEDLRAEVNWLFTENTFFKYFQGGWNASGYSTDYDVIAVKGKVDREWLKDDAILVFQPLKLKEGLSTVEFDQFINGTWKNLDTNANGSIRAILKSTRGYRENEYIQLWAFENVQARNEVFPYEGIPADASEEELDKAIGQELKSYLSSIDASEEEHYEIIY